MKPSNISSFEIKSNLIIVTLLMAFLFLLASCQKDEVAPATSNDESAAYRLSQSEQVIPVSSAKGNPSANSQLASADKNILGNMILKIDHHAARSLKPDYSVTVFSNGKVIFEGRRNVAVLEKVIFQITKEQTDQLVTISRLFLQTDVSWIKENTSYLVDVPQVVSSFSLVADIADVGLRIFKDDDSGKPVALFSLRTKIENILNVSRLIYPPRKSVTVLEKSAD